MRVQVYKNLRRGDWTITAAPAGRGSKGRVVAHQKDVTIADAVFYVSRPSQAKIAAGAHRMVHAWAIGELVTAAPEGTRIPITYRPHIAPAFVRRDNGQTVDGAPFVHFTENEGAVIVEVQK